MEKNLFSKFNVYDQIGYLMVGAIGLLLLVFDLTCFSQIEIPTFNLNTIFIWIIVAYFIGHLIQGFSNLISNLPLLRFLIKENKKDFSDQEKKVLKEAEKYFGLEKQDDDKMWNFCYMFASAKDITGQVQSFNAYYGLYRGWLIVFLFQSLFLLYWLLVAYSAKILIMFIASTLIIMVFYRRSQCFWKYLRGKTLETFIIVKFLKL